MFGTRLLDRAGDRPPAPGAAADATPAAAGAAAVRAPGWRRDLAAALPAWVCARVVVLAALALAKVVFLRLHPITDAVRLHEGLLGWDGQWYLRIAAYGYGAVPREALRFFPLYPLLARALGLLPGVGPSAALVLVANVLALVLGALLHRLVLQEGGDAATARRAAWLVAVVPPAFVLAMAYSEPLSGCLAVGVFLAMRRGRWSWAAVWAFLGALTRPVGALIVVPMVVEAVARRRGVPAASMLRRLSAAAAPLAGMGLYLAWVAARFGDPRLPWRIQQASYLRGGLANPVVAVARSGVDFVHATMEPNGMHFVPALVLIALAVVAFRRWPAPYGAFAAVTIAAALSAERLGSLERYGFGAFPVVLALASLAVRPEVERAVFCLAGAGLLAYSSLAFLNVYVP